MTVDQIKAKIEQAFKNYMGTNSVDAQALASSSTAAGKIYESYVLALLVQDLATKELCQLTLSSGTTLKLKTSGGPINPRYPKIIVRRAGAIIGEIWTDIHFTSWSYWKGATSQPQTPGDFHELDIVMTTPGAIGKPTPDQILIGIECKDTPYQKRLLREVLGVRRELSLLRRDSPLKTGFNVWPRKTVPADPPSCLLVYSSSPTILNYSSPGETYGIDFFHEPT